VVEIAPQITIPPLNASVSAEDFRLHEAALEWSLADPIIIESSEDIKSRVNWQDRLQPFHHQIQNLMTFCRRLPVTLLTDDVGLGKTISAGLILSELMIRNRVARTLVICPKILGPQWIEELESKFGIRGVFAVGKQLQDELQGDVEVVATTYSTASNYLGKIEPGKFDMLILDEAHKLRNLHGSQKPPKLAQRLYYALNSRLFKYVLMLTATPIQNRLWDIYSLVDCLAVAKGHVNPLGSPDHFRYRYIADHPQARKLNRDTAEEFRSILRQYLARTRRQDAKLLFPEREVKLWKVEPSAVDRKLQALVANCVEGLNGFQQTSIAMAMMSSPQAHISQLRNMAKTNAIWNAVANEAESINRETLPSKLRDLLKLIQELSVARPADWRLVIFTTRLETQNVICQKLELNNIAYGRIQGSEAVRNTATVKAYSADPPTINVIVSTDAGAEGVNLQKGNVLVNYDLPWNPMIVEQRIGRVQRLGSKHQSVVIHNLAVEGSPEERVVVRLMEKLQTIVDTVGDIEAILEASFGDSDSSEDSFESQMRELVMKSLAGQDVAVATKLKVESIQNAKSLFEEQREFIDSTLGQLNDLHSTGPSMPRLTPVSPSVRSDEFVRSAMEAEGFTLTTDHGESLRAQKRGQPLEYITFDEKYWRQNSQSGVFQGKALRLYTPGKPAFERLVQRWLDRSSHFTKTFVDQTQQFADKMAYGWLSQLPGGSLESVEIIASQEQFQGRSRFRVTASNAIDSYEKLVDIETVPPGHDRIFDQEIKGGKIIYQDIEPTELMTTIAESSRLACANDSDIAAFCQFYRARLSEEVGRAGHDPAKLKKVTDDFSPAIHARAASLTGVKYQVCRLRVLFAIDGHTGYSQEFGAIPLTGQIVGKQELWDECEKSQRSVPPSCLESCCISGKRVLRHYLKISDESGRKALEEYANTCSITGRIALNDEFLISDLSGQRAVASAFQSSEISGRRGLLKECLICEITGSRVLLDEFEASEITGKKYRRDQMGSSAVSNRSGHRSEFVVCDYSESTVLNEECDTSAMSGRLIRRDLLEASVRPPNRHGSPDEMVVCPVTSNRLLMDETDQCAITNQRVDNSLLATSDESGQRALITHMVICEHSGRRLLPDETTLSAVSNRRISKSCAVNSAVSNQPMFPEESVTCEITGVKLLPAELVISAISGKSFRLDEQVKSEESGRVGHRTEGNVCSWSRQQLLADEVCESSVSGRSMRKSLARESPLSSRVAHPDEFKQCQFSDLLVLPDELVSSDVSGKAFRFDDIFVSGSGRRGHKSEAAKCEFTAEAFLVDEVIQSGASGKLVSKTIARPSDVSGRFAAPDELVECEVTGAKVLASELIASDATGRRFRCDENIKSEESGRIGHRSEAVTCEWSRRLLLADEATHSDFSGRLLSRSVARTSPINGRIGHFAEFRKCEVTGVPVLPDELSVSDVSGRSFRTDEVFVSDTGRSGHQSEQKQCQFFGETLLSDEVVESAVSGKVVSKSRARRSVVSNRLAAPQEMVTCEITQVELLPLELVTSSCSGRQFRCDEQVHSDGSNRVGHQSESVICEYSNRMFLEDEMAISDYSGKAVAQTYLRPSPHSGRHGTPTEFGCCAVTDQTLLLDELGQSVISGRIVDKSMLIPSDKSGELALEAEMVHCQISGAQLLPDETTRCAASELIVDSDLVRESDFSGARALPDRMFRCSITGQLGIPQEFGTCELTDDLVARSMLRRCEVTGKFVRRDRLVQSSVSQRWMIPAESRKSLRDGRLMCPDEAAFCNWNRGYLPKVEIKKCLWTRLTFSANLISTEGLFDVLVQLMNEEHPESQMADAAMIKWIQTQKDGNLKSVRTAWFVESPKGGTIAVFGELTNILGFKKGVVAFLMRDTEKARKILDKVVVGNATGTSWSTL
jgi:superfamily II DNA or RNA helicase